MIQLKRFGASATDSRCRVIRHSLAFKIGFYFTGLVIIVVLGLYASVSQIIRSAYYQQQGIDLQAKGHEYAQLIATSLNPTVRHVCSVSHNELLILNRTGTFVDKSSLVTLHRANQVDISGIKLALTGQSVLRKEYSAMFGNSGVLSLTPIVQGKTVTGVIALFQPYDVISRAFARIEQKLWLVGIGAALIALGLTMFLSHGLIQPLVQMSNVADAIGRGNYTTGLPAKRQDEIGRLAKAIQDMTTNLHRLDTTRKEFLADIAHELRTPLSYIHGYSQVLREGLAKSEADEQKSIDIIYHESERIEKLVNDLFTLAQTDEGILKLREETARLDEVLASVVERYQHVAEAKGIRLDFHPTTAIPKMRFDPMRMEQVMVNLLDNAIHYTPSGGVITVDIRHKAHQVQVVVADTGVGIAADELPYIWDRLYRVEKSRSREQGGTGLGLAVVKRIVELHGGKVGATSREGGGTSVAFTIPVYRAGVER